MYLTIKVSKQNAAKYPQGKIIRLCRQVLKLDPLEKNPFWPHVFMKKYAI